MKLVKKGKVKEPSMKEWLAKIEQVIEKGPYQPTWASLSRWRVPQWFQEKKFGIFIHWGVYSVPAYDNEWYSRNMYIEGMKPYEHHIKTYGPHKDFGYKDFIPMFQAKQFNPNEWAQIFKESGAQYVFPVAEHHDGFQMYKSSISKWNAYEMGPKRDILGELKDAFEKEGLVFCTSSHRAEHCFFMSHGKKFDSDIKEPLERGDFYWPAMPEAELHDMQSKPYPSKEYLQDWLIRTCEIIDNYQPRLLYFDWWIQHEAFKPYLLKLAAYYYNRGEEWGTPVALCYKHDAMMFGSAIVEVERGGFAQVKPYAWQTDTAVARNSWCYTDSLDYKSSKEIIWQLIDVVSKNGNLLLNIGPKADGTIPEGDRNILKEIGEWLKINGEAIYNSKVWRKSEEGPTKTEEGQFMDGKPPVYTKEDFRFTVANGCIYAFAMEYPDDGEVKIESLKKSNNQDLPEFYGLIKQVFVLGYEEKPQFEVLEDGLHIRTKTVKSNYPVVFKIEVI